MSRVMLLINAHAQSRKLAFLIVSAFSGGRAITIQKRKVSTRFSRQERKNSFSNENGYVWKRP